MLQPAQLPVQGSATLSKARVALLCSWSACHPKMLSSCGRNWEKPVSGAGWGPGEALRMLWLIFSTSASSAARVPQEMRLRLGIIQVPAQKVRTSRRKSIQMRSRSLSPAQPDAMHHSKHHQRSALQGCLQACRAADCSRILIYQANLLFHGASANFQLQVLPL